MNLAPQPSFLSRLDWERLHFSGCARHPERMPLSALPPPPLFFRVPAVLRCSNGVPGLESDDGEACCAVTCSQCGGVGCSVPGPASDCCATDVAEQAPDCSIALAGPCYIDGEVFRGGRPPATPLRRRSGASLSGAAATRLVTDRQAWYLLGEARISRQDTQDAPFSERTAPSPWRRRATSN